MSMNSSQFDVNEEPLVNDINMTPFIDVMLVLLIVFMITLPVINHAVKVNLPKATATVPEKEIQPVDISIMADGSLAWNKQIVDQTTFMSKLTDASKASTLPDLRIYADKNSAYGKLAWVMTSAQSVGLTKFSFVIQKDK